MFTHGMTPPQVILATILYKSLYLPSRDNYLSKHRVRVAIGSDSYRETSAPEARFLASLKVFDHLTLLKMWCETTAEAIFPGRKIGRLKDGYEASFLVLAGDPLKDFSNTGKIEMRVKQGGLLSLP